MYYVYILECSDKKLYVGYTSNVERRLAEHNSGNSSTYTGLRKPVKLLFTEKYPNEMKARKRELQLKGWSRKKKLALIKGDVKLLQYLSRI